MHVVHVAPGMTEWHKGPAESDAAARKAEQRERLEVALASNADLVAAVGPLLFREISNLLHHQRHKIYMLTPGLTDWGIGVRQPPPGLHCLLVGRAEDARLKGIDIAARAFGYAAKDKQPRPVLVVRGTPKGTSDTFRAQILKWSGVSGLDIRVREYASDTDRIRDDILRATVLLMPSRVEGFGLVALEALGAGTPILAAEDSGFGEMLLAECGALSRESLVPVMDDESSDTTRWGDALGRIFQEPAAAFLQSRRLQDAYRAKVNWTVNVKQLLARIQDLNERKSDLSKLFIQDTNAPSESTKGAGSSSPARAGRQLPPQPKLLWKAFVGIGTWKTKPQYLNGTLIVPSAGRVWNARDELDGVAGVNPIDGSTKWRVPTSGDANSVELFESTIFVGTDEGELYAIDGKRGESLWVIRLDASVVARPKVIGDRIIAATVTGTIYVIDREDGHHIAVRHTDSGFYADPLMIDSTLLLFAVSGGMLVVPASELLEWRSEKELEFTRHYTFSTNQTGDTQIPCQFWGSPTYTEKAIIIPYARDTYRSGLPILALDPRTYNVLWNAPRRASDVEAAFGNIRATPCVAHDMTCVPVSYGSEVACLTQEGAVHWIVECGIPHYPQFGSAAAFESYFLVPRFDGFVHMIHAPSGRYVWKLRPGDRGEEQPEPSISSVAPSWWNDSASPLNSPLLVVDSVLYIHSSNGFLYAYSLAT
ncbi:MAG: PQQ-binding-like beta-propeller repeat protein [Myxococcales bacterium]|nr:PQQ-binding-like beta-propeller repeat protein [Myxococcales bacterium]